jgi:hypothetical protein
MSTGLRVLILSVALFLVFGASVAILLRVIPGPHTEQDYLVAGGVATLVTMLALFVVLITTWVKAPNVFYRKREGSETSDGDHSQGDA